MTTDEFYMARCLQLAKNGELGAAPNPMVGAVIVCDDKIIGEGYHIRCGCPHAEVNAFNSVTDGALLSKSTLYVSLEPCAHYGRTPPCARLVVEKGVRRVVVGCVDPFAKVHGRGIQIMRDAGIEVDVGILEKQCQELNRRFFTFQTHHRPYIILKWAQTADGVMGLKYTKSDAPRRLHISNPCTMLRVHHLRATSSAILVGYNTALLDNPSLTTRLLDGPNPVRVVLDPNGQLPADLHVFDNSVPTIVAGWEPNKNISGVNVHFVQINRQKDFLPQLMQKLYELNLQSLLVEGGASTLNAFITAGLWDEAHVEHAAMKVGAVQNTPFQSVQIVPAPAISEKPLWLEPLSTSVVYHYRHRQ